MNLCIATLARTSLAGGMLAIALSGCAGDTKEAASAITPPTPVVALATTSHGPDDARVATERFLAAAIRREDLSPFLSPDSAAPRPGQDLGAILHLSTPVTGITVHCSVTTRQRDGTEVLGVFATVSTDAGEEMIVVEMAAPHPPWQVAAVKPASASRVAIPGGPC